MKQSKKVQIASESKVKVTSRKVTDTLAVVEIQDKLMTEEHIEMLQAAVRELLDDNVDKIVIDLSKIKRINSSGLGSLISLYTAAHNKNGVLKIGGYNEFVKNVLNITKLAEVFEIHPTQEDCIKSFS
ncbi:STAS domain-containing protein [bacterium]|nr:MAG: STAS domain-containing protein [bacterium]